MLLTGLRNGDLPMFALFLVLALFFWLSQNMGGMSERILSYSVELTGVDKGIRVTRPIASPVYVTVSGSGMAMMKEYHRKRVLNVDAAAFVSAGGSSFVASSTILVDSLSSILPANLTIKRVLPDSLRYESIRVTDVRLPVLFGGTFDDSDRYSVDGISFTPDSVTVNVPEGSVLQYSCVVTDASSIKVDAVLMGGTIKLVPPGENALLADDEVNYSVTASQMTEKTVEVPVSGLNLPYGTVLRTFPPKVKVQFQVSLADFDAVDAQDFMVALDYRSLESSGYKAEVSVVSSPENVTKVRVTPELVEYLVENHSAVYD